MSYTTLHVDCYVCTVNFVLALSRENERTLAEEPGPPATREIFHESKTFTRFADTACVRIACSVLPGASGIFLFCSVGRCSPSPAVWTKIVRGRPQIRPCVAMATRPTPAPGVSDTPPDLFGGGRFLSRGCLLMSRTHTRVPASGPRARVF